MKRILGGIAEGAGLDHRFLGDRRIMELRELLKALPKDVPAEARFEMILEMAQLELRMGNTEKALEDLARAEPLIGRVTSRERGRAEVAYLYRSAVANMRLGENLNCVNCNNGARCIFPIQEEGVHENQEPSRNAIEYLQWVLEHPRRDRMIDLSARWLLNIAYMTVGEYPAGVPPEFLIASSRFESGHPFPRFKNVAMACGVNTFSLCGGAVVDDFDNDSLLDIMVSTYDLKGQMKLFLNRGSAGFVDATISAGLEGLLGGLNMVQADYDNDGNVDVFVLRGAWMDDTGRHPNSLLRNNGNGTFTDVTFAVGLGEVHYPTQTAAWADYDNDGDLDLYVGNESTGENVFPCQLFRNDGDKFSDVALEAGVTNDLYAKGLTWGDFDGDRDPDLFVSNLYGVNRLYRNEGDGTFEDVAEELGVSGPVNGFPSWFWDYDNDGQLDLYVATFVEDLPTNVSSYLGIPHEQEIACLYRWGGSRFRNVSEEVGLNWFASTMGSNFGDLDNDGWLDFYLGTGFPSYDALIPNRMIRNHQGREFVDITAEGGFGHLQKGHGIAFADLDNDGDQDVFEQMGGALLGDRFHDALYENPGNSNHWVVLQLVGSKTNRSAIGARVHVVAKEGGQTRSIYRHVNSGGSFGGNPLRREIGLGHADTIERIEIFWPTTGRTQVFRGLSVDKFYRIVEGQSPQVLEPQTFPLGSG